MAPPPKIADSEQEKKATRAYRERFQVENAKTQELVIAMAKAINPKGGYILVNELEAESLFSHVNLKGKKVLEVGCGTLPVTMAIPCYEMPEVFLASDVSWAIVSEARTLDTRPNYAVFSALEVGIKPGSLDFIILNGVLHHLPPDANLLGTLAHLLSPQGRILMLEPNVSCFPAEFIKWILRTFFKLSMEASPYGQFSRRKIESLVERGGLKVREEWFCSLFAFPLTGGQGRRKVLPDSRLLFKFLTAFDELFSKILNFCPPLARLLHWRSLYLLSKK